MERDAGGTCSEGRQVRISALPRLSKSFVAAAHLLLLYFLKHEYGALMIIECIILVIYHYTLFISRLRTQNREDVKLDELSKARMNDKVITKTV